jgi:hypothetical protein
MMSKNPLTKMTYHFGPDLASDVGREAQIWALTRVYGPFMLPFCPGTNEECAVRTKASGPKAQVKSAAVTVAGKSNNPPQLLKPLTAEDFHPTPRAQQIVKELYDWERQSAKVQFRVN